MTHIRELYPFYIGPNDQDIKQMLDTVGADSLESLFNHIEDQYKFSSFSFDEHLNHPELKQHIEDVASKNKTFLSFAGDGLPSFKVPQIVPKVCNIRGLTTAYTPYQPERSQGTLQSLWIYQNLIAKMTGFRAINASLYERSTCLQEALSCATRLHRKSNKVLVSEGIYPGDKEVLETIKKHTSLEIDYYPLDKKTGKVCLPTLTKMLKTESYAGIAITQINCFGVIEEIDELVTLSKNHGLYTIALVEMFSMSSNGLKEPSLWGLENEGADILVAEGQHLTLAPNYGGPGLGIFGIRHDEKNKNLIRSTAGRFIGLAKDDQGVECKTIVLSTREQHIRREKATSNICSNQSFIATACGAALLERGSSGFDEIFTQTTKNVHKLISEITTLDGVDLLFQGPFFNQFTLKIKTDLDALIQAGKDSGLEIGLNISNRLDMGENLLLVATSDLHGPHEIQALINFFKKQFKSGSISNSYRPIQSNQTRIEEYYFKAFDTDYIENYYKELGEQNFSPDSGIYPLGSCTMKYNPEINDWAASLPGFTNTHPQSADEDVQGNLEILHYIQEAFKNITGLPAVTTQPVAGAQGELVGLKMFQAYHEDNGEKESRNIILIPRTAHGTNPATATMAGFETKKVDGVEYGIVAIEALPTGEIDFDQFASLVEKYNSRIAGVMITNPNTSGIFESNFGKISKLIHQVGGLVYMDGANMNAIAGWVDLNALGVDAVHNNLHKTWSIPHGGGGPGDGIVAVSDKLVDYLPGVQIVKTGDMYKSVKPKKSIGSFHRHQGNFAHKVRAYTYLRALGEEGIRKMSAVAVLNARYLFERLKKTYPSLPADQTSNRMHEFILTLAQETFDKIEASGTPKAQVIPKVGKLFLDFGFHAPTVAFPELYGLMFEPTESFTKKELDDFASTVEIIFNIINESPEVLQTTPHFAPVGKVDELRANRELVLFEDIRDELARIPNNGIDLAQMRKLSSSEIIQKLMTAHRKKLSS